MRAGIVALLTCITSVSFANEPDVQIHTKNGSVFYGQVVERADDHVTLKLATGVSKRFDANDIDPDPVPASVRPVDDAQPTPMITIRTKDGSAYHGALVERVVDDHVTLKLATNALKTIAMSDIDPSPPSPEARAIPDDPAPLENIRTKYGSFYRGEVIEKVALEYVRLMLATGELRTIAWDDIVRERPKKLPPPKPLPRLRFHPSRGAHLEVTTDGLIFRDVCTDACDELVTPHGLYRVTAAGFTATRTFDLDSRPEQTVTARLHPSRVRRAGNLLGIASIPMMVGATVATLFDVGLGPSHDYVNPHIPPNVYPADHTASDFVAAFFWSSALTLGVAALVLIRKSAPTLLVSAPARAR